MRVWHDLARLILLVLALGGCTAPPDDPDASIGGADARSGILTLGEGEATFRAIEDGDTLLVARGCQGSQHVWITLRSEQMDPRGMIVELAARRADDGTLVSAQFRLRLSFTSDPSGAFAQLTGLTLQIPEPDLALGHDVILSGTIQDRAGLSAIAERRVRIEWGTEVCSSPTG